MMPPNSLDTITTTKFGSVVTLKSYNWNEFYESCVCTLVAAEALEIVQGTEIVPAAGVVIIASFKKRRGYAISILTSSISSIYRSSLVPFLATMDVAEVRKQFSDELFDPKTQTLRQFLERLLHHQLRTVQSARAISDEEVHSQLMNRLPDTEAWQIRRNFAVDTAKSLNEAMITLSIAERPVVAFANYATNNSNRGRGGNGWRRGRGGRGRGRGRGRDSSNGNSDHVQGGRVDKSRNE